MKLSVHVSEDRQLIIPAEALEPLHLEPGEAVEIEISQPATPHQFNQARFDAAMAWAEAHRAEFQARMREDGYASVDELMADLRPEW